MKETIKGEKKFVVDNKYTKHSLRFLFFCLVGGASFLIDWSFFNIFYAIVGLGFGLSITFSVAISMVFNFSINRNITFNARGYHLGKQMSKWLVVYLLSFIVRLGAGKITLTILGESLVTANIAFIIGIGLAIPISFLGSLLWAFKKD